MKILSLIARLCLFTATIVPAAAEKATFIEKPKVMGDEISTITTYQLNESSGFTKHCRGECFSDHVLRFWTCHGKSGDILHCTLSCTPPPVGGCTIE